MPPRAGTFCGRCGAPATGRRDASGSYLCTKHRKDRKTERRVAATRTYRKTAKGAAHRHKWNRITKLKRYGITPDIYDVFHKVQGGTCAICRQPERTRHSNGDHRRLSVDHDHATDIVRGLLCGDCNMALGLFRDDTERLRRAIEYLESAKEEAA